MLGCLFLLSEGDVKQRSLYNRKCPVHIATEVCEMKAAQSRPTLCKPMDYTVHIILQARTLEWVAFPSSRGPSQPGIEPRSPVSAGGFFLPIELPGKPCT